MKSMNKKNQANNNPFFSVLIPNYGYSKLIFECLDSIVNQENDGSFDYEIIMCDQSNPDIFQKLSTEISERYKNKINLFHNDIKGLFKARHTLMKNANGKYIIFVDSDDFVDRNYLITMHAYLKNNNYPDMVLLDIFKTTNNGDKSEKANIYLDKVEDIKKSILYENKYNNVVSKVFARSLYNYDDYKSYDFETTYCEDKIFSIPLVFNASTILFDNNLCFYHYRDNNDSLVHNFSIKDMYDSLFVLKKNGINVPNIEEINRMYISNLVNCLSGCLPICNKTSYKNIKLLLNDVVDEIKIHPFSLKKVDTKTKIKIRLLKCKMYYIFYLLTKII